MAAATGVMKKPAAGAKKAVAYGIFFSLLRIFWSGRLLVRDLNRIRNERFRPFLMVFHPSRLKGDRLIKK